MIAYNVYLAALFLLKVCWAASKLPLAQPTYITRYDYVNVDTVLSDGRISQKLMDCIMDRGPCTEDGKQLKLMIGASDALHTTNCSNCNKRQKIKTGPVLAYLLHYKPQNWFEIMNKYDQDGSLRRKLNIHPEESSQNTVLNRRTRRSISSFIQNLLQKFQKINTLYQLQELKKKIFFS